MRKYAIVLAAGKGTRMESDLPKCIYPFLGKPMIKRIIDELKKFCFDDIIVVVGHQKEMVKELLKDEVVYIEQLEQLGTADAVQACRRYFNDKDGICLILPSDIPLIDINVINGIIISHISNSNTLTIATSTVTNNKEYGLIYRQNNNIKKIIEYKDASNYQRRIKEINSGIYCIDAKILFSSLDKITNNNKAHEYYLTDIVSIISNKYKVASYDVVDSYKIKGVNDLVTLKNLELMIKQKDSFYI